MECTNVENNDKEDSSCEDWYELVQLPKGTNKYMKFDTGANCNTMSKYLATEIGIRIHPSRVKKVSAYGDHKLNVLGEAVISCTIKNRQWKLLFYIVDAQVRPILGQKTCTGLIKRVHSIETENNEENNEISEIVYQGLGKLKGFEYDIDFVEHPQFTIHPPRRIPYAIRSQVKEELDNMEKLEIIYKITEPTPVVSPLVVVRQRGKIRICIDPSDLNKQILRRHYPLRTLEEVRAATINGAK